MLDNSINSSSIIVWEADLRATDSVLSELFQDCLSRFSG